MAYASAYDEFNDPGMALSTKTVSEFDTKKWLEALVLDLVDRVKVADFRATMPGGTKPKWWITTAKRLRFVLAGACDRLTLEVSPDSFDYSIPEKGKLKAYAVSVTEEDFLSDFRAYVENEMRKMVTIVRNREDLRQVKATRSFANKSANVGRNLLHFVDMCEKSLESRN